MEADGQDEVPRILSPSRRPRRKRTKWPKASGGQKAPGVSHGETLLFDVGGAPKRRKEEEEISLSRSSGENVRLPQDYRGSSQ